MTEGRPHARCIVPGCSERTPYIVCVRCWRLLDLEERRAVNQIPKAPFWPIGTLAEDGIELSAIEMQMAVGALAVTIGARKMERDARRPDRSPS